MLSHFAITGDLTMRHAAGAFKQVAKMPKSTDVTVDLSGTGSVDSSAVAFLLNCIRLGRERGSRVTFAAVPASVLTLADIYGLRSVIEDASGAS